MVVNNLFQIEDFRRRKNTKPKPTPILRPVPVVNLARITLDEFRKTPELRVTAQMEMMREYIDTAEKKRTSHPRVSAMGITLCRDIIVAQRKGILQLRRDLFESTEKDWFAHPNRYLAIMLMIEELAPPPTNP